MTATSETTPAAPIDEDRRPHWRRLATIFVVETVVIDLIVYFGLWHHLPPGDMTDTARGAQFDTMILIMLAAPITVFVVSYLLYGVINWRQPKGGGPLVDGPPIRSNLLVQTLWIGVTSAIVFGAFVFGTYELVVPAGAGGGEGPSPIWVPASANILPIQVIGQQWQWTYRYPTFGGFETTELIIPDNTEIAFHVTSLDVIHDFWAYQLGVKADANPAVDNVAFTKTAQLGRFVVRCDELCGIWHGAMYNYGQVVTRQAFYNWGRAMEAKLASATKLLPKFAWTYVPSANGASGSYYPGVDPVPGQFSYSNGQAGPEGNLPAPATTKKGSS
jgi:cytochrome c oxidase subunit 2